MNKLHQHSSTKHVTATWLLDFIFDQELSNYIIYSNDCKSRGGGVLAAVKHTICATAISKPDHLEAISLHPSLCMLCIYSTQPPPNLDSTHISSLVSYLSILAAPPCSDIIVVADFNLPDIEWDTLSAASHSSEQFCDFVFNFTLKKNVLKLHAFTC